MLTQQELENRVFKAIGTDGAKAYIVAERLYQAGIKAEIKAHGPFGDRHLAERLYRLHGKAISRAAQLSDPLL